MEQPTPKDLATFFSFILDLGICRDQDVESWADELVARHDGPIPVWLLNISSEQSESKRKLLEAVPGKSNESLVWKLVFAHLRIAVRNNLAAREQVANRLYRWTVEGVLPDTYHAAAHQLDDDVYGVSDGRCSRERFLKNFEEFFSQFDEFECLLPKQAIR